MPAILERVGIDGPGAVGGTSVQFSIENPDLGYQVVGINYHQDTPEGIKDRLAWDSMYGHWKHYKGAPDEIGVYGNKLLINGQEIRTFGKGNIPDIPWEEVGAKIIIESARVEDPAEAIKHIKPGGVERVIVSSSTKDGGNPEFVYGVNHKLYDPRRDRVIFASSCTTNCAATTGFVLNREFGMEFFSLEAIHALTSTDGTYDKVGGKPSIINNAVPESTGASLALARILPELAEVPNHVNAIRNETNTGSLLSVTAMLKKRTSVQEVIDAFKYAEQEILNGVICVEEGPVSAAYTRRLPFASVIDESSIKLTGNGKFLHMRVGYDNVWGYTAQLARLTSYIAQNS
ncbi:MAG: glyceraldehyde 3-phosphate dehydrogenase NAD-binding domain-containing protein [Candidatus Daviesbacteria bacterium]|nr:glyceraldehyde 3-phosphate dehydrogenase NAD-binding domain-containing protein [Candidatus Daviesbacteria bacterium]